MRDSKFSEDKSKSDSCSKSSSNSSTKSGCHCGSKQAGGEVEEMDIIEMEEKFDKRFEKIENRLDVLENKVDRIMKCPTIARELSEIPEN